LRIVDVVVFYLPHLKIQSTEFSLKKCMSRNHIDDRSRFLLHQSVGLHP